MSNPTGVTVQPGAQQVTSVPIVDVLRKHYLQIKDFESWHPDMAFAKQLLYIGTHIVGYDHLLIQHVRYDTQEQLQREITTLGIKKDILSPFDISITFMPKYCYPIPESFGALLVHSVPPFTLEALLSRCEKTYPADFLNHPVHFYRTWFTSILSRYRNSITDGKSKFLKAAGSLKDCIHPSPPRIPLRQRKRFAALIAGTVLNHHNNGILHDDITSQTVFLRAVNQPVILANYTGKPSRTVEDAFPVDFSQVKQYLLTHGQHMRDVFSCAQITYRILTGHAPSPSGTFRDAPRPITTLIRHFIERSALLEKHSLREYRHYIGALVYIFRNCTSRFIRIFSQKHFRDWRYCNRATGGIWRSLPVIGPVADIFFPTRCAAVLRSLLDYHWFYHTFIRIPSFRHTHRKVGLQVLFAALRTSVPTGRSEYGKIFSRLQGDAAQKRHTFDSIMEGSTIPAADTRKPKLHPFFIVPALLLIVTPLFFIGRLYHKKDQSKTIYPDTVTTRLTETPPSVQQVQPPQEKKERVTSIPEIRDTITVNPVLTPEVSSGKSSPQEKTERVVKKRSVRKKTSVTAPKKFNAPPTPTHSAVTVSPETMASESLIIPLPPPPSCHLVPATDRWNVYYVEGDCLFSTISELKYSDEKSGDTVTIGNRDNKSGKYYIARKTKEGYGKIETVRRCIGPPCQKGMYYKSGNRLEPEVVVAPGDIVGFNYFSMNAFLIRQKKNSD